MIAGGLLPLGECKKDSVNGQRTVTDLVGLAHVLLREVAC